MTGERPRSPHHLAVREAGEAAFAFRVPLPLHRAIYVSDAVGGAATSLLILAEILGESERNNRREGLTSALMRHGGQFLQIIEGRRTDVDRLMDRLRVDPRHENLRLLSDVAVSGRRFGDWPMILAELTPEAARLLNGEALDQLSPARAETLLALAVGVAPVPA
ncbi:Sensors of blue-light using FAD [Brevundimonas vancanneytii]|uniref:Sensors of blue-light using FAD n=1 Tax=Brevundimonas vancanneytii TaxID=1325724 RepID=A0A4P1KIX1_9CAUL|nr:Sensors of blue-light using FAD [Brevundimonas vancanneytii]